jgi:CO/xanthine dehydrogenase Mo-binding subunit
MTEYRSIGKRKVRKDAWDKAAGKALYTADILQGELSYGLLLRSPHHHARILGIEKTQAEKLPGVQKILTSADIPGEKVFGPLVVDQPSLALDVVRHMGEPVALIIAETRQAAELAREKIKVDYEPLKALFDPVEASRPGAIAIHPGGNLLSELHVGTGDVEKGFEEADVVLEETFYLPRISPGYMEPESSLAVWMDDGTVTVWVSSQHPFTDQAVIAAALDLPLEQVRVKSAVIGGAFGGKEDSSLAILAALGAQAVGGAIKLVNSRRESFLAHPKRHPAQIRYKLGAKKDGTLTAVEAEAYMDTGAYSSYGPAVAMILTETMTGSYRVPHVKADTYVVYTNSPLSGAMRGFGSPQTHFAVESSLDMMAEKLGMDPIEFRKKNILKPGDKVFTQVVMNNSALALPVCLEKARELVSNYRAVEPTPGKVAGVGLALAGQSMGLGANVPDDSTHRLEWTPDGKVLVYLGSPELGQGLAAAAEQITAEALGIDFDQVETVPLDTLDSPNGNVTCASRMTYLVGNALKEASGKLVSSLLDAAAGMLEVDRQELSYHQGMVRKGDGTEFPAAEFISRLAEESKVLMAESTFSFPYPEETTPQHLPIGMPHVLYCFGVQVARVEVDPELGSVEVTHLAAIHDVGKAISLLGVEGQIEGGVATGLGYALFEDMIRKDDRWVDSFTEYLLPTAVDLPSHYQTIILEVPEASGPYGAKGVGEIPLVPTAPAVANAVYDAVKVRVTRLPITPERVLSMD